MKRKLTKAIASVLAVLTVMTMFAVSAFAEDDSVTVNFACSDAEIIMPYQTLQVKDGLAEEYGFTVSEKDHNGVAVEDATFFDAIIASHIAYYGDAFTKENAKDYVDISYGYLTKAFARSASMSGFIINKVIPNDGIIGQYGTFTGYSADTARIKDGDSITFYFYQDTDMWGDWTAWFDKYEYTSTVGTPIDVNLKGYSAVWYGTNSIDTIMSSFAKDIAYADIYIYSEGNERVSVGSTDENGNAQIKFDEAGTYILYAEAIAEDEYGSYPVIYPWCTVEVTEAEEPADEPIEEPTELTWWQKVVNFIVDVYNKVVAFFVSIFDKIF